MELKITSSLLLDEEYSTWKDDFTGLSAPNSIDKRNCSSPLSERINEINGHCLYLSPRHEAPKDGPVYFFDLDNTIYPKSSGIAELMVQRIELFFVKYLQLPAEESKVLGARYYQDYGLAIKGLIKNFSIDPLAYDEFVDGGLPLDDILKPQEELTNLLDRLSRKGSCWVFTNAGQAHAIRVINLLHLESFFSGIIYCNYSEPNFPAKPDRLAFARAMQCAHVDDPRKCFFFDDAVGNIRTAQEIGWNVVYVDEDAMTQQSSMDEINASLEILTSDPLEDNVATITIIPSQTQALFPFAFPTIRRIEEVERILNKTT